MLEQRFADRHEDAFREVHERYRDRLHAAAYQMLGDREFAADATQLTFLRAWQAAGSFDPQRPLEPWLFAIGRRAAIDIYRRQRGGVLESTADPAVFEQTGHGVPDDTATQIWLRHQVRRAIGELKPADQAIVGLVFLAEHTHREAADRLGIPLGTLKSRLHRAQRKMTVLLRHVEAVQA